MHIKILVKGLPESSKVRRLALNKLNDALALFAHAIQEAKILLDDINGPHRGGVDKLCRVVLRMKDNTLVVVEELGTDIGKAINRVADRLQQSVARQLPRLSPPHQAGVRQ